MSEDWDKCVRRSINLSRRLTTRRNCSPIWCPTTSATGSRAITSNWLEISCVLRNHRHFRRVARRWGPEGGREWRSGRGSRITWVYAIGLCRSSLRLAQWISGGRTIQSPLWGLRGSISFLPSGMILNIGSWGRKVESASRRGECTLLPRNPATNWRDCLQIL